MMRRCNSSPRLFVCLLAIASLGAAQDKEQPLSPGANDQTEQSGIQWGQLIGEYFLFTGIQNAVRIGTQDYTRAYLDGKFFDDWGRSIGNLHGWGDGDSFPINYMLHPMEGSVDGFLFIQNDRRYRRAEFGRNRAYWKSRARAALFTFIASEQFELGPVSEASIGNVGARYPQQGLADHVVTPTLGLAWMLGEDALDQYVVKRIEARAESRWVKALARSTLNPTRSMANLMRFEVPWHRDTRSDHLAGRATLLAAKTDEDGGEFGRGNNFIAAEPARAEQDFGSPTFDVGATYSFTRLNVAHPGSLACNGGGSSAALHISRWFAVAADVDGCKMRNPGANITGDTLTYVAGPRVTFPVGRRWIPYAEFLAGGDKLSIETTDTSKKPNPVPDLPEIDLAALHESYTRQAQTNAFAIKFGGGVDYTVNRVFGLRLLRVDDTHTWAHLLNGRHYPNNLSVTFGVVVRFGTW